MLVLDKSVLIIIIFLQHLSLSNSQSVSFTIDSSTSEVQQSAIYTFKISLTNTATSIPSGSSISIIFPDSYDILPLKTYVCQTTALWTSITTISCGLQNRILKVTGGFPGTVNQSSMVFEFRLFDIANPLVSGQTKTFDYKIVDSSGNTLAFPTFIGKASLVISVGTLVYQMSVSPSNTNANSTLTVNVTSPYKVPKNGYLNLRFETFWKSGTSQSMVISSVSTCSPGVNVSAGITCSLGTGTSIAYNLIVKNMFDNDFTGSFSFIINSFLNPPTTAAQGAFQLSSFNSLIEKKRISVSDIQTLSGFTMSQIPSSSAKISIQSSTITTSTEATIECYINNIIQQTDTILIQFPGEIKFSNAVSIIANNFQATDVSVALGNLLSFKSLMLNAPGTVTIVVQNITLPDYVNSFRGFWIRTERNSSGMEFVNDPFQITTTEGPMSADLMALNNEIGVYTDYQLTISLNHAAQSDSTLTVEFGVLEYQFTSSIVGNMSCTSNKRLGCMIYLVSTNTFKFSNIFINSTSSFKLTIKNIQNILTLGPITPLIITSYKILNSREYSVDKSTQNNITIILVSRKMLSNQVKVTSSSNVTYDVCDLFVMVNNSNPVPAGAYIQIEVPAEIDLGSNVACGNMDLSCDLISVSNPTKVKVTLFSSYPSHSLPLIIIKNAKNPISTTPTSSFAVSIFNSNQQLIECRLLNQAGITYTALESRRLLLTIDRNSTKNSESPVEYKFTVGVPFPVTNGVLKLQIPNFIECISLCTKISLNSTHYALSKQLSTINNSVSLTANFKNHYSFETQTINVRYFTSSSEVYEYGKDSFNVTNDQQSLLGVNVRWTNQYLGGRGNMTISNIAFPYGSYSGKMLVIVHFVDTGFDLSSVTSSQLFSTSVKEITLLTSSIQIQLSTYEIQNLLYPSVNQSYSIFMIIKTQAGYTISKSSRIQWSINCQLPCRTCLQPNKSACSSCYNNSSLMDGYIFFHQTIKQCLKVCGDRYYANDTDNKCYSCSLSCGNCLDYDKCLSCKQGWYLLKVTSKCYQTVCPQGYFINGSQCTQCTQQLNCKTCSNADSCDSCGGIYYFYQNTCSTECPLNKTTTKNSLTNVCDRCPGNCVTCEKLSNQSVICLTCYGGYYFGSNGCYESCTSVGMVPSLTVSFTCTTCDESCLTCLYNQSYCLSCNQSSQKKYFLNNSCLSTCPNGYYKTETSPYYCATCTPPCQYCTNSSATSCRRCRAGYSLINSSCQSTCPAGYYSLNNTCVPCINQCRTCQTESICFTCSNTTSIFSQRCIPTCPAGYVSVQNVCAQCSSNCKTCSSINYCTTCYNGSYLQQGQCLDRCPVKFFKNQSLLKCFPCPYQCSQCQNQTYCSTCQLLYSLDLDNNSCINSCGNGQIPYNGVCARCDTGCTTCIQTPYKCTVCDTIYYFVPSQNKCLISCPQPLRHLSSNMSCLLSCPQASYQQYRQQNVNSILTQLIYCQSCPQHCASCTGPLLCTSCLTNTYMLNQLCFQQCPESSPYAYNGTCRMCNIVGCYECDGQKCKQCASGLLLIGDSMCISQCSSTQAYNTTTKQCDVVIQSNTTNNNSSTNTSSNSITSTTQTPTNLNFIPFPFFILSILLFLFILVLYFSTQVLIIPLAKCQFGIFSMCSAYATVGVFLVQRIDIIESISGQQLIFILILLAGIGLILIFNIIVTSLYLLQVSSPPKKWPKILTFFIFVVGTFINFTSYQMLNSKLYHFVSLNIAQNKPFWSKYSKITKISSLSYLCFIVSGIVMSFKVEKSDYLYYSFIQLVIMSVLFIGTVVIGSLWPIDYTLSEGYSENLSDSLNKMNDSFNKLEDFSIDQKNQNLSEDISSTTTIRPRTQVIKNETTFSDRDHVGMIKTKSQFLFHHNCSLSSMEILPPEHIIEGIEKGLFRQDYEDVKKRQLQEKELSLLSSASKMVKRMSENQYKSQEKQQENIIHTNQINIFDIDNKEENDRVQGSYINHEVIPQKQATSKSLSKNSNEQRKVQNEDLKVQKPGSPQKSRKRSKQTIRVKSIKESSDQSNLQLKNQAEQKEQIQQFESQNKNLVKEDEQDFKSEKQQYYYRNPNIIFESIDEDLEAEDYETKVSQRTEFNDEDIEQIDIYKYPTNRSNAPLIPVSQQKIKAQKISQPQQIDLQPIINHIRDTEVDITSSHHSQSSQLLKNEPQSPKDNKNSRKTKEQNFINIFQPKDDLQFDEIQQVINQNPQKNNIKKEIIHADLQSIYTVSDRGQQEEVHQKTNQPFIHQKNKNSVQIPPEYPEKYRSISPSLTSQRQHLIEDIQDFDQDNQRPSSIFQPPVKNLLSDLYDQLPIGLKPQRKQKKRINTFKKTNKK